MKAWRTDVFTCLEGVRDDNLIVCVVVRGCSGTDKVVDGRRVANRLGHTS